MKSERNDRLIRWELGGEAGEQVKEVIGWFDGNLKGRPRKWELAGEVGEKVKRMIGWFDGNLKEWSWTSARNDWLVCWELGEENERNDWLVWWKLEGEVHGKVSGMIGFGLVGSMGTWRGKGKD